MERVKKLGILRGTKQDPGNAEARVQYQIRAQQVNKMMAVFSSSKKKYNAKKILRHIKLTIHAWSTKCR
jgi:predicted GTPase